MSTISASTTSTTAYKVTADTTGTLVFQTGASPTTAMTLGSDQSVTFAGTPTYSGGTANGVAYLNGSKVLTTGTALVFTGTNLGIGTASPQSLLDIQLGSQAYNPTYFGTIRLNATTNPAPTNNGGIEFLASGYQSGFGYRITASDEGGGSTPLSFLYRSNSASWTEGMRLTNGGNLVVGATSSNSKFTVVAADSVNPANIVQNNSTASSGVYTFYSSLGTGNAGNTNCAHLRAVTQNVAIYNLYGNGTSSFTSDARLKKNIETARDGYAEDLCKLRVVKYQWNANDDDSVKEMGLIAQEVEQVFPGLVNTTSDTIGDVENAKELKFSVLPFMLLKALQEQQAVIEQLKADVATLKGAA